MSDAPRRLADPARSEHGRRHWPEPNTAYPATRHRWPGDSSRMQHLGGLAFLTGLWLVVAPRVLSFDHAPVVAYDDMAVGGAIAALGLLHLSLPDTFARQWWLTFALGLWVVVSPLLLRFPSTIGRGPAIWNGIACGVVAVVIASYGIVLAERGPRRSSRW